LDDPLSKLPGYALRRAANAMMSELGERLAQLDLRISDASVLLVIAGRLDLTSSDIGRTLDIQRANMVPLLNRLEVLTEAGRDKLKQVRKVTGKFEKDLMAKVPEEHREHLVPALNALWR
jgi:DNA-binding MarR family transcriptional regulator